MEEEGQYLNIESFGKRKQRKWMWKKIKEIIWGKIFRWKWKVKGEISQLCLTLCDPMDYTVHAILQAWILEWVAFSFSRGSS